MLVAPRAARPLCIATIPRRLHARRATGGDRDHRHSDEPAVIPGAETMLVNELQFSQGDNILKRFVARAEAVDFLVKLAGRLEALTSAA